MSLLGLVPSRPKSKCALTDCMCNFAALCWADVYTVESDGCSPFPVQAELRMSSVRPASKPRSTQHSSMLPPPTNNYPNQKIKRSRGAGARCEQIPINLT